MHGNDFSGRAGYGSVDYLECEWGVAEDGMKYTVIQILVSGLQYSS
ncbi:MAG: hypothetical protein J5966_03885 [Lachnospiraceae bacterium]|nr:hypothetical protein [Lachnospiraceae bacterium]